MADVNYSGPLFDGRAERAVAAMLDEAREEVAQTGYDRVQAELSRVLRHPTGYYQSRITTERRADTNVVHDSGVVYGPWLEGTGSRNRTTRFKGYTTFRRIRQRLDADARGLLQTVVSRRIGGLR